MEPKKLTKKELELAKKQEEQRHKDILRRLEFYPKLAFEHDKETAELKEVVMPSDTGGKNPVPEFWLGLKRLYPASFLAKVYRIVRNRKERICSRAVFIKVFSSKSLDRISQRCKIRWTAWERVTIAEILGDLAYELGPKVKRI